jgi:hypothetical protein
MREPGPPSATLTTRTLDGAEVEVWACYWCMMYLIGARHPLLGEREVHKCRRCGHFQVIGTSEAVRRAAVLDHGQTTEDGVLRHLREVYRQLHDDDGKPPSQRLVAARSGRDRSVIRKRWARIIE